MTSFDVADFVQDVLTPSFARPILVDFWADWCGPCKVLGPVLERLAATSGGRWELRKLDTEAFTDIAAQYGIRSIPNVKLFWKGNVINEFVGALPEASVVQWLEKALPDPFSEALDAAESMLHAGKRADAERSALSVLSSSPGNERARAIAASAMVFHDPERARELVRDMDEGSPNWELAGSARELSALLSKTLNTGSLADSPVREKYLRALQSLQKEDFDTALAQFIDVIREERYYDDDGSRKACIAIFKVLGEEHEITQKHRRDFGTALYI